MFKKPTTCVGIDVGGTKILGVLNNGISQDIISEHKLPTPKDDPDAVVPQILKVLELLMADAEELGHPVSAVGVGVPGLVDHSGVLRYGPNVPGVLNLEIASIIRQRFGLPAIAENDGTLAALLEHRLGAASGHDNALVITQGTGIGAGLIMNGQIVRGANGFAGEPGHALIDPEGPMCACQQVGCWEALSSGAGLANIAKLLVEEGKALAIVELAGGDSAAIRGEHVAQAFEAGDSDAAEVFDRFATWVAVGISNWCALLDPSVVVLGGGLASISQHFIEKVEQRVPDRLLGAQYRPAVKVVPAKFSYESGALGAALRAKELFKTR